jgi:hypothetical protein
VEGYPTTNPHRATFRSETIQERGFHHAHQRRHITLNFPRGKLMSRWRKREGAMMHEYIAALYQLGYETHFDQILITDVPERPAHYVRIMYLKKDGQQVYRETGLSVYKLLADALNHVKNGS